MEGHLYLIKGIPKSIWKEFQMACIWFDTTAKHYLITCMSDLVIRYHRSEQNTKAGPIYKQRKEKKR